MITCQNCSHVNPDGASTCEACFTPLASSHAHCPSCNASVQPDATFCGQCGYSLKPAVVESAAASNLPPTVVAGTTPAASNLPPTVVAGATSPGSSSNLPPTELAAPPTPVPFVPDPVPITPPTPDPAIGVGLPATELAAPIPDPLATFPPPEAPTPTPVAATPPVAASTQLQQLKYQLLHVQTNATIELPLGLSPIHLGKPNDRVPPDIDVSGFPSSEVVSRVHANLIREGDNYYVEDIGSANGTYVNHAVLPKGNRHLLRQGDRIGLGKGDLVSFIFQADPM